MATVRIDRAGHGELLHFVTNDLNLQVGDAPTKADLVELIRASGYMQKTIEIDDQTVRPTAVRAPAAGGDWNFAKIIIARQDKPGGSEPVWVQVNGRPMFIPRGEPVVVARRYVESALGDAVEVIFPETADISVDRPALSGGMETPRFSVTVLERMTLTPEEAARIAPTQFLTVAA